MSYITVRTFHQILRLWDSSQNVAYLDLCCIILSGKKVPISFANNGPIMCWIIHMKQETQQIHASYILWCLCRDRENRSTHHAVRFCKAHALAHIIASCVQWEKKQTQKTGQTL